MIEAFCYWLRQKLGYRLLCYDQALARGIRLTSYKGWEWLPRWRPGTYRERISFGHQLRPGVSWGFAGYGVDK